MIRNWIIFIIFLSTTKYIISSDRQFVPQKKTVVELTDILVGKLEKLRDQDAKRVEYINKDKKTLQEDLENLQKESQDAQTELAEMKKKGNKNNEYDLYDFKEQLSLADKIRFKKEQIAEIEKKLQEISIITDEQAKEIKDAWNQLLYALLEQNHLEADKDSKPVQLLKKQYYRKGAENIRLNMHSDKFKDEDNRRIMSDLFKITEEWNGTSELQIFIKKQKLARDANKFIEFVDKLKKSDAWPSDISQKEFNDAKKLWIDALFYSDDISKHYETMDEDTKNKINALLNQSTLYSAHNKAVMANLLSFIKSSQEQTQFIKLQVLQNTFHSYLYQLKMCDGAGQDIQNNQYATLKKLWVSIISFDKSNKSLLDMDAEFQTKIQHLSHHWVKNGNKMNDIFGLISSGNDTAKLVLSYQPREQFILHLQKLRELDNQGKDILDSDISQLRTVWDVLKQNDDAFFQDMDEEFRITTKIYSLPHKWKLSKNRTKLTEFFRKALIGHSRLTTIASLPVSLNKRSVVHPVSLEKKEIEEEISPLEFDLGFEMPFILNPVGMITKKMKEEKQALSSTLGSVVSQLTEFAEEFRCSFKSYITKYPKLRPLFDPNYSTATITLRPKALNRRIKSALRNLQISSMPAVALNEIKELSCQVMLLKKLYNYNWLDRILYPFHRDDIQSLESDLSALYDKDLLKAIHPETLTTKGGHSQQDIAKAAEIANIIEDLKTNLLTRPDKPFEIIFAHAILGEALPQKAMTAIAERVEGVAFNLIGKIAPNSVRSQYEKDIFSSLDHKIENQRQHNTLNKQALKQRKDILRIEIEKFRIKAGVRFQASAI